MITFFDYPHEGTITDVAARIGGKGASLWAMTSRLGLPVPPGFTIGTEQAQSGLTPALLADVKTALDRIGCLVGRRFGDPDNPLLVSVRSGAPVSMPGMMDTILNVGIDARTIDGFGDVEFARATHRNFREQFAKAVPAFDQRRLDDPDAVLSAAIEAVFASWNSARAVAYRAREGIACAAGTAVTVQAMVFGHRDARSGTGVVFRRDPSTGAPALTGDWLAQAQGEAVVAGTHATQPIAALAAFDPTSHAALVEAVAKLERFYGDMVDVEFTIESGRLWILQARVGKRSPAAAARIAHDLVIEGLVSRAGAAERLAALSRPTAWATERTGTAEAIAQGLGVSPGVVSGRVALDCDQAIDMADNGHNVILVRTETSPDDVHGMGVSAGILTKTGGLMSHAAVVAREWGIAAVCGADIDISDNAFAAGAICVRAGDIISIDGRTGEVFLGIVVGRSDADPYAQIVRQWVTELNTQEI